MAGERPTGAWCVTAIALLTSWAVAGCAADRAAVAHGRSASLDGDDLVRITDQMAMELAADPDVRAAIARDGPLPVVVLPVENRMTGEVLPRGAAIAFTARVRTQLARAAPDDFVWVINRDEFHALRRAELAAGQTAADLGPSPDVVQPRYALHARFQTLTRDTRDRRSLYYLCVYELTDIDNRVVLWTGSYELKKTVIKGFLD
ncbi:MAG: hypothetical protein ACK4PI_05560 [Tepidisphaerales bacterium]